MRVIVIGGGISGLVAAFRLAEGARRESRRLEVLLLEAESRAGGHAWSTREDGFLVEAGPNAFLDRASEPQLRELVSELGLESRLVEARPTAKHRFVMHDGRLHAAPDSPQTLLSTSALSTLGKARVMREPWVKPALGETEETVYDFACRRVGREVADRLVDPAVSGITAGDSRKLSVQAAFPQIVAMERRFGSLMSAMKASTGGTRPRLVSFDGGMATLVDALTARLGDAVRTGRRASRVTELGNRWSVECEGGIAFDADCVVLALPAAQAAPVMKQTDAALAEVLSGVSYAGLALVALAYRAADVARSLDGYGYLVGAGEGLDTLGVVWESSLFDGRAPEGYVLLRVLMGGARRPEVAGLDEAELVARARRELAGPLGVTAVPQRTWVRRWPGAIPQYEIGHLARVAEARALAARRSGLALCGTSYDGVSFTSAVRSGIDVASRVLSAATDPLPETPPALAESAR